MGKDKGGKPRAFGETKTKRLGLVLPESMYFKIYKESGPGEAHGTISELVNAALELYFEAQEKKDPS